MILLTLAFLAQGAENLVMREAGKTTDGAVYLAINIPAGNTERVMNRVLQNGGELVAQVTAQQTEEFSTPLELFSNLAKVEVNPHLLENASGYKFSYKEFLSSSDSSFFENFHAANLFFGGVASYYPPYQNDMEALRKQLEETQIYLVKFPDVKTAYDVRQIFSKNKVNFAYEEIFSNALTSYAFYKSSDGLMTFLQIAGIVIATVIAIGTYVYLLDQSMRSAVVYRALGANTFDLFLIALGYIVEVGLTIMLSVLITSLLIALAFSGVEASYLSELFMKFYGYAPTHTILIGFNQSILWMLLTIVLAAPVSLILTLDQFSTKRLSRKLKQE